jgi:hypothetical protein
VKPKPEEMSANYGSENCDVKTQNLAKLETYQRFYYIAKCVGDNWFVVTMDWDWGGGCF